MGSIHEAVGYYRSQIPAARSGPWRVEKFTAPEPGDDDRRPPWARARAGLYTRLRRDNEVFMTDLPEEWWTQKSAIDEAWRRGGAVLISGLGLGVIVESLLRTPTSPVGHVTVLESSPDVLRLVGPQLSSRYGKRLEILQADAFHWHPPTGATYSVVWHDLWPNPYHPGNLVEMERLERRFAPLCDWQGFWGRELIVEG